MVAVGSGLVGILQFGLWLCALVRKVWNECVWGSTAACSL